MTQLALTQGAYEARNVIANAQVCINLYPEPNPKDAPFPVTHYPAPGLSVLSDYTGTYSGPVRGLYDASNGMIFAVIGQDVIQWKGTSTPAVHLGTISNNDNPVSIVDNTTEVVFVDGTSGGWHVTLANANTPGALQAVTDPAWYGSTRVDYIDTFLIFNQPGTANWYTSLAGQFLPLDPTYTTPKAGYNDRTVAVAALHDNVWVLGAITTEVWFNAGAATFAFARMPNSILQQGCVAPFSPVIADNAIYWLSQDRWGRNMAMRGEGYAAKRISTFAIEDIWSKYTQLEDAIGMAYQIGGHESVAWYFRDAAAFWVYDASSQLWHQRTYQDLVQPWLPRCMAGWGAIPANTLGPNSILAGDRTGPRILMLSRNNFTDCGTPIMRQRSWPHVQQDGKRIAHTRFAAAMAAVDTGAHTVTLDWSDDAGQSFGAPVPQTASGGALAQFQWRRLGYARDRVYRMTWGGSADGALNGAWIDVEGMGT